jgi:hypothetical protein
LKHIYPIGAVILILFSSAFPFVKKLPGSFPLLYISHVFTAFPKDAIEKCISFQIALYQKPKEK